MEDIDDELEKSKLGKAIENIEKIALFVKNISNSIRKYFGIFIGAILLGIFILFVVKTLVEHIFDTSRVPSWSKEIRIANATEFNEKFKQTADFYKNANNCIFDFVYTEDNSNLKLDLSKVLYYEYCKDNVCINTIDGDNYSIKRGADYMNRFFITQHLEQCAAK